MKKLMNLVIVSSLMLMLNTYSKPIKANENEPQLNKVNELEELNENTMEIRPLEYFKVSDKIQYKVIYEDGEAYFYNESYQKTYLIKKSNVMNVNFSMITELNENSVRASATLEQFYKDFTYNSTSPTGSFVLTGIAKNGVDTVKGVISGAVCAFLKVPSLKCTIVADGVISELASLCMKYPGDSNVRYNYKRYTNKMCSMYLNGYTWTLTAHAKTSNTAFSWDWLENPVLSYVGTQCKMASQTYWY